MLAVLTGATLIGVKAFPVQVEVDIASKGLPGLQVVGLPETVVKESQVRVKAALENSGYSFPLRRTTINLAPADLRKSGSGFDLPFAIGILAANGIISQEAISPYLFVGELSLQGQLREINGCLPFSLCALSEKKQGIILPSANLYEASLAKGLKIIGFDHLTEVVEFLLGNIPAPQHSELVIGENHNQNCIDLGEIKGQYQAKRALEIAAAGGHNLLMIGPPGSGKTMLAKSLSGILPPLSSEEIIECTSNYSAAGIKVKIISSPPFRSPHHTISDIGMVGGGNPPQPGEITLAHRGVLFLDELTEFRRSVLESLRQPIEEGEIIIVRSGIRVNLPAKFTLVAAMNPCQCGYLNHPHRPCTCSPMIIQRYKNKISGPLLDRIDLQIEVPPVEVKDMKNNENVQQSSEIRKKVQKARQIQRQRYLEYEFINTNSELTPGLLKKYCTLDSGAESLFYRAIEKLHLSTRVHDRILKVARTIADLTCKSNIEGVDIAEALQYRFAIKDKY